MIYIPNKCSALYTKFSRQVEQFRIRRLAVVFNDRSCFRHFETAAIKPLYIVPVDLPALAFFAAEQFQF